MVYFPNGDTTAQPRSGMALLKAFYTASGSQVRHAEEMV